MIQTYEEVILMLFSVPDLKQITTIPHEDSYWACVNPLSDEQYDAIYDNLDSRFSEREVDTSSWIPGSDWTESVFEPLYFACNENQELAGMVFGIIVWVVVMSRPDDSWSFGRYEKDGVPIKGMTYFRIDTPAHAKRPRRRFGK
jgi:hypothetical protein